jgi:benzoylformate decarboxylase
MSSQALEAAKKRVKISSDIKLQDAKVLAGQALREKAFVPIAPSKLMQEIKENLKPGTRIVDDCWSCSAVLRRTMGFSEAKSYQRSRNGGSIGWGLPGSLGVKLASPDRPVVCVSGDGSAMWSIQSLWTAAHYEIPVTFVICANQNYQQVRIMKTLFMGEKTRNIYLGTDLSQPVIDFCQIAGGMGIPARQIDNPEQLGTALKEAFNLGKPNLVEVRVDSKIK